MGRYDISVAMGTTLTFSLRYEGELIEGLEERWQDSLQRFLA